MNTLATYYLENIFQRKYSVNKISRTIQTFCYGKKDDNFLYQVLVLDLDFSDKENSMNVLLKKIALVFDELELEITPKNTIEKVINLSFIRKRWIEVRNEILLKNQGDELVNYCNSISKTLENENALISFLQEKRMLGMIFNGYTESNSNFTFTDLGLLDGTLEEKTDNENIKYTLLCLVSEKIKGHSPKN